MGTDSVLDAIATNLAARELGHPVRVAIDGITASGKSTFADGLARAVRKRGRPVIRITMDGFHRPRADRHRQGRMSGDGYYEDAYDLTTAARDLLAPLGPGGTRRYRPRCHDLLHDRPVIDEWALADPDAVLIVDGSFLLHPDIRAGWDEVIYLDVTFGAARLRGVAREATALGGEDAAGSAFDHRYHAAGRRYLREVDPREQAGIVVDNNDVRNPVLLRLAAAAS